MDKAKLIHACSLHLQRTTLKPNFRPNRQRKQRDYRLQDLDHGLFLGQSCHHVKGRLPILSFKRKEDKRLYIVWAGVWGLLAWDESTNVKHCRRMGFFQHLLDLGSEVEHFQAQIA
jgi:hypothetical protein